MLNEVLIALISVLGGALNGIDILKRKQYMILKK